MGSRIARAAWAVSILATRSAFADTVASPTPLPNEKPGTYWALECNTDGNCRAFNPSPFLYLSMCKYYVQMFQSLVSQEGYTLKCYRPKANVEPAE